MNRIVHLHGLESTVDAELVPVGGKARALRAHFGDEVALVPLDTSAAVRIAHREFQRTGTWAYPFPDYEEAFALPLARARAAITPQTELITASSFGGAVLLRLLHEAPVWRGPCVFLAGAGLKLTPYDRLPADVPCLCVHGTDDRIVPFADSEALAATSPTAELRAVADGHRLTSLLDEGLIELVRWGLDRAR